MQREAVRVQQPDGSFKVIFRENSGNQKDQEKKIQESMPAVQNTRERPRKDKKEIQDPRYFNPLNPGSSLYGRLYLSYFFLYFFFHSFQLLLPARYTKRWLQFTQDADEIKKETYDMDSRGDAQ